MGESYLEVNAGLLRVGRRWNSDRLRLGGATRGPFVIIGREKGLALDTGIQNRNGSTPIMWPPNGFIHQLWKVRPVRNHWAEYTIESLEHGLVLDAGAGEELSRNPTMRSRTGEPRQRWRFSRVEDGLAYVIRSVLTGHALDFPVDSGPHSRPHLWECHRELHQQFLLASVTVARLREFE
ncbi:RICIN domain-containing protein [Amycolatopsis lexingtonensis]|uniref:RICIN domain-containing protein n=1 Tax=Amycolatopsis lexingtonensis TaxID=218822 RepID=UPI003F6F859F